MASRTGRLNGEVAAWSRYIASDVDIRHSFIHGRIIMLAAPMHWEVVMIPCELLVIIAIFRNVRWFSSFDESQLIGSSGIFLNRYIDDA